MKTTTATYKIDVTQECGNVVTYVRTMPTRPTTTKGQIAQMNRLENWVSKVSYKPTKVKIELQK
jgi:hypothetical protein